MRAYKKPGRPPCEVDGCGQPLYAKGLCTTHYNRLRRRGDVGTAGRERGRHGEGSVNNYGYLTVHIPGHPLATAQGKVYAHRAALFDKLGPDPQPCHWGCGRVLPWRGGASVAVNVDHLDANRLNNDPANLVASCLDCNTKRGVA